ncbi:MAG: metal ABC transporter substrate-binding protein, partial [Candidatus Thermoplasmatota archaeon]|nr:metal ABC transporter substrate-binding protein [Candidatus Thermoplasmatota archaeon]
MNTKTSALIFSIVMVFSSFVGCIDADEDDTTTTDSETNLGNVLVSTYHVGELVKAVGGDRVTVEIISPSNVPVHDYEPSAADLIKLQETDLFFYHGLNLEPWVDSTVSSLGSDAPLVVRTHAMPSGENTLDYQSMLLSKICETLNEDAYEAVTLADHHDEAGDVTIHAEA